MSNFTEHAVKVLEERYLLKDERGGLLETPDELLYRVSHAIAYAEDLELRTEWRNKFHDMLKNLDFLPNSPCLANAGKKDGQLAACFVLPVEDDIDSIFKAVGDAAKIHKTGGGTGFSFSRLRARDSIVASTGHCASGPVSFMEVFDAATGAIKQGGMRRGANMGILRVDHPDILEFIHCKDSGSKITNFNISVGITDKFMKDLDACINGEHLLNYNGTHNNATCAHYIWEDIANSAWKTGDPGVVFLDVINNSRSNPVPSIGPIESTNPCLIGNTTILRRYGFVTIESQVGKTIDIWNGYEWSTVTVEETGQNQPTVNVIFSDGSDITCTPYHKFIMQDGKRIEAKFISVGDELVEYSFPVIEGDEHLEYAYTHGAYSGDGGYNNDKAQHTIWLYGVKMDLVPHLSGKASNIYPPGRIAFGLNRAVKWDKLFVPDANYTIQSRLDWFAGLLDTDGGSGGNHGGGSIAVWSVEHKFLEDVKYMLHTLGIKPSIAKGKDAELKMMPNGNGGKSEYQSQDSYRILIRGGDVQRLKELGLKTYRLDISYEPKYSTKKTIKVVSVEEGEIADKVYCFNEPLNHSGMFNGVVTAQCGEVPLYPYDSCNLGSINLGTHVVDGKVDFDKLKNTVHTAIRFMDNMVSCNSYTLPEIGDRNKQLRRLGLGPMGLHDALIKMGIPYASDKAVQISAGFAEFIQLEADKASISLGHEKGSFQLFNESIYVDDHEAMRNCARTCTAPTGTISIIAGCSSGIEPIYALSYEHHGLEGKLKGNRIWNEAAVNYMKSCGDKGYDEAVVATALEIDPIWHLKHQAAWQKYTDNAVSKTINMPFTATPEDIKDAYQYAYDNGCKGVTVFRNGSRDSQVLNVGVVSSGDGSVNHSSNIVDDGSSMANVRPTKLSAVTIKQATPFGNMYVTITDNDGPYELFATIGKAGSDVQAMAEALGRSVSKLLRESAPDKRKMMLEELGEQFSGIGGGMSSGFGKDKIRSIPDALSKVIRRYCGQSDNVVNSINAMSDNHGVDSNSYNHTALSGLTCPDCGMDAIAMSEGCETCQNCGWSKC